MSEHFFAKYLESNDSPTPEELVLLISLLKETREDVARIDKELQAYHKLLEQRKERILSIERLNTLLSPIRRLADDIMAAIFHAFIGLPAHHMAKMGPHHPSVVLSHVCRRWREVALGDPRMWSSIHIRAPCYPIDASTRSITQNAISRWSSSVERLQELTQIWISRSRECPLTFSIAFTTGRDDPNEAVRRFTNMVNLLCAQAHRWKDATLCCRAWCKADFGALTQPILALGAADVPMLQSLMYVFHRQGSYLDPTPDRSRVELLQAETLRSLTISIQDVLLPQSKTPKSWQDLTSICLLSYPSWESSGCGYGFLLDLLATCSRLVSCEVYLAGRPWAAPHQAPDQVATPDVRRSVNTPLTHCHLRSMIVRFKTPSKEFAEALSLPSLTTLRLQTSSSFPTSESGRSEMEALVYWLKKFGPQLTEAWFPASNMPDLMLEEVLGSLSNLVSLSLVSESAFPSPHHEGRPTSSLRPLNPIRFPNLESLRGNVFPRPTILHTEESLLEFIAAHASPLGALRKVDFTFQGTLPTVDMKGELRARGVDVDGVVKLNVVYGTKPLDLIYDVLPQDNPGVASIGSPWQID